MKLDLLGVRPRGTRGVALVIVLSFLVLITGLIIAFFSNVSTELTGAKSYASGVTTKQLADSATQIVMAQISAATSGTNIAWASQPGMIRTYGDGNGGASADELAFYKLYSSKNIVVTGSSTPSIATFKTNPRADVPSDWSSQTAVFTDLNAPVATTSGTNYPIIDPSAFTTVDGANITGAPKVGIDNPAPMPTRWLYVLKDGTLAVPDSSTGTSGTTATFSQAAIQPSAANPIVGRIAFWTDDETCKVNINTASEGIFWDVPRVKTTYDYTNLANNQPAQHEFQRYPGHPATTSLSPVFPKPAGLSDIDWAEKIYQIVPKVNGGGSKGGTQRATGVLNSDTDRLYASLDEVMFTPALSGSMRNTNGLSKSALEAAKFFLTAHSRAPETNLFNQPRIACWPIYKDLLAGYVTPYDKLIAFCSTINNLPYYFQRQDSNSTTNDIGIVRNGELYSYLEDLTSKPIPGFGGDFLSKYAADRNQIITEIFDYIRCTNLRDDNLPVVNTFTGGKTIGRVIPTRHLNGTMGFGRMYTISELGIGFICNADGTGFKISGQNPALAQCNNIQAIKDCNDAKIASNGNTNIVLGGSPIKGEAFLDVGYGSSKTGENNNVFDWDDTKSFTGYATWKNNGRCDFEPWNDINENGQWDSGEPSWDGNGNGVYDGEPHEPLHDWGCASTSQPAWVPSSWPAPVASGVQVTWPIPLRNADTQSNGVYDFGQKYIQAIIVPEFFCPMMGFTWMGSDMAIKITGLDKLTITTGGLTQPLGFPLSDATSYTNQGVNIINGGSCGGNPPWQFFGNAKDTANKAYKGAPKRGNFAADTPVEIYHTYPFISEPIKISSSGSMDFVGGTIALEIYAGNGTPKPEKLVQTISINLPSGTFPIPNLVADGTPAPSSPAHGDATTKENWWAFSKAGAVNGKPGRLNFLWQAPGNNKNPKGPDDGPKGGSFFRASDGAFDVVRTVLPTHGDYRLVAASPNVSDTVFGKHPYYDDTSKMIASNLASASSSQDQGCDRRGKYISTLNYDFDSTALIPDIPASATLTPEVSGDFDAALAYSKDGPFINKPDEGSNNYSSGVPYFDQTWNLVTGGTTFFSPNRQIPSPGMFGSLPTGVIAGIPWKTLLFRPQTNHPSYVNPEAYASSAHKPSDHLLLDLFWMPVVEPYAISDRFSTAGKINLNYQIVPFTYIERSTGIRALLKSEKLTAIHNDAIRTYKSSAAKVTDNENIRLDINSVETLKQFTAKFDAGNIFKSASEICDLHIVPTGESVTKMADVTAGGFWPKHALTGENLREKIYTTLYPRLTTKSNTYTVHFRVQALQKLKRDTNQAQWVEGKDLVTGEYRGSTIIERYIDSNDPDLPDFAKKTANPPTNPARFPTSADRFNIDNYYKFRVVSTKQFAP